MKKLLLFLLITVAGATVQLTASEAAPRSFAAGTRIVTPSEEALSRAAEDGVMPTVLALLNSGVNADNRFALCRAILGNHPAIIELLIMRGADVNSKSFFGQTPLMWADRVATARLLLQHKADVNAVDNIGESPLSRAASTGNNGLVRLLLEHQADVTQRNSQGQTALDIAQTTHTLNEDVIASLSSSSKPQEQKSSKCIVS